MGGDSSCLSALGLNTHCRSCQPPPIDLLQVRFCVGLLECDAMKGRAGEDGQPGFHMSCSSMAKIYEYYIFKGSRQIPNITINMLTSVCVWVRVITCPWKTNLKPYTLVWTYDGIFLIHIKSILLLCAVPKGGETRCRRAARRD